jgi:hypothetical protein
MTGEPNELVAQIHTRMPVILPEEDHAKRLGEVEDGDLKALLKPLEQLRTVLGLDPVEDADGSVIREAPLAAWANFRQRALNIAIAEINAKTDLNIALKSVEKADHSRVSALIFAIKARTVSKGKPSAARPSSTSVP